MNTIFFIFGGALLSLVVLSKIPGLEHLVKPLIDLVFSLFKVIAENAWSWAIWLFKLLWDSHIEMVQHLALSAEALDPTLEMRKRE